MDRLRNLLGLLDDGKRIYHVMPGEIEQAEYAYSQLMFDYLFDDQIGVIATLGPTWGLVHDPRFNKIENCFIRTRRAILGGDATQGVQHISDNSRHERDGQNLEQYATLIGEGRHFRKTIVDTPFLNDSGSPCTPHTLYQESDATLWRLIRQECPNYFTREGKPNREATTLYNLFREDLVGLVEDYAELPQVDEMVNVESGEVYVPELWDGETPIVNLEIDLLEKALTARAHLRLTAYNILERLGFMHKINEEQRLTDWERDELLRIVYTSRWPEERTDLALRLMTFIQKANRTPYEEREKEQLALISEASKLMVQEIKDGTRKVLNQNTDPGQSMESIDPEAAIILSIQTNPYKADLFAIYAQAESRLIASNDGVCEKIVDLLRPVFESTSFDISEDVFQRYIRQIRILMGDCESGTTTIEGTLE
jgi:hypothetical protein